MLLLGHSCRGSSRGGSSVLFLEDLPPNTLRDPNYVGLGDLMPPCEVTLPIGRCLFAEHDIPRHHPPRVVCCNFDYVTDPETKLLPDRLGNGHLMSSGDSGDSSLL